jgi:hypothetical protein
MQVSKKLVKIQAVIDKLQNAGYYIQLWHCNHEEDKGNDQGFTVMQTSKDEVLLAQGVAFCAPDDSYNKVKGTQIAFGRMMEELSDSLGPYTLRALLSDGAPSPASDVQVV